MSEKCNHILTKGPSKGEQCKGKVFEEGKCKTHINLKFVFLSGEEVFGPFTSFNKCKNEASKYPDSKILRLKKVLTPAPKVKEVINQEPAPKVKEVLNQEPAPKVKEVINQEPAPKVKEVLNPEPAPEVKKAIGGVLSKGNEKDLLKYSEYIFSLDVEYKIEECMEEEDDIKLVENTFIYKGELDTGAIYDAAEYVLEFLKIERNISQIIVQDDKLLIKTVPL